MSLRVALKYKVLKKLHLLSLLSIPDVTTYSEKRLEILQLLRQNSECVEYLTYLVLRHKIVHIAHANLLTLNEKGYEETTNNLYKAKVASTIRQTILQNKFELVCQGFNAYSTTWRPVKGFNLSERLYSNKFCRDIRDIDIWIPRDELSLAHQALIGQTIEAKLIKPASVDEYQLVEARCKDLYYKLGKANLLELHMRLLPSKIQFCRYLDSVLAKRELDVYEEFIYLCVHGVNSGFYRLRWLTDLYLFIQQKEIDVLYALDFAKQEKVLKQVLVSLFLMEKIFRTPRYHESKHIRAYDLICARLGMNICYIILGDDRPRRTYKYEAACTLLQLICITGKQDLIEFLRFFFGSSKPNAIKNKNSYKTIARTFLQRLVKLVKN